MFECFLLSDSQVFKRRFIIQRYAPRLLLRIPQADRKQPLSAADGVLTIIIISQPTSILVAYPRLHVQDREFHKNNKKRIQKQLNERRHLRIRSLSDKQNKHLDAQ